MSGIFPPVHQCNKAKDADHDCYHRDGQQNCPSYRPADALQESVRQSFGQAAVWCVEKKIPKSQAPNPETIYALLVEHRSLLRQTSMKRKVEILSRFPLSTHGSRQLCDYFI